MSIVKLKKSSVPGKIPQTSDLDFGEIAVNYADGVVYYKNTLTQIQSIGSVQSTPLSITTTTASTSTTTGALVVKGGVGIGGNLNVGGVVTATNMFIGPWPVSTSTGGANFNGGTITNPLIVNNVTASTSTTTGALQVAGGVGVGGNIYTAGRVGFVNASNTSSVYQVYNAATNSLDTVFG